MTPVDAIVMLQYAWYVNCRKHECTVVSLTSAVSLGLGARKSKFGKQGGAEVGQAHVSHDSWMMKHEMPVNQDKKKTSNILFKG